MFLEEQHARPCNNYRSTGIQIRLLSVMFPIHGNVERTGSELEWEIMKVIGSLLSIQTLGISILNGDLHFSLFPRTRLGSLRGTNSRSTQWHFSRLCEHYKC